ncbi:FAD-binding oxidoreductase [Dietzia sp. PP-33]|jgi:glycolate oxidase|uniref:FAD-binding oxidoreductase n=1 Tax=Dietzia sp. PP-33 TaxID=2957500 RepID=UPI0029BBC0F0|nr:FAD-linked oxidase C-terminal domain-containing protein [Dietzia sp. PP-33]MDX2356755.1 FAD-binding protein [Dietzia sp. PP-33]
MTLDDLRARLPGASVLTDTDVVEGYRRDWAEAPDPGMPLAVVRARSTEDVQEVMRWASECGVPVVPRGAGSGLSGGATAVEGGIVLTTELMREINVDPVTRTATVQPGLFNAEVKRAVAEHGLWYPPDPSSYEICSIGGNVATNAGGLCCVKYGVTTDYVLGLTVVLADGTAVRLGGARLKDTAGLSLTKLFVGSEGTLGIVTEIIVRLIPTQPPRSTVVGIFPDVVACSEAVLAITRRIRPAMLEFMDNVSIRAVEADLRMGLDTTAGAMLLAQSDLTGPDREAETELMAEAFRTHGATEVFATDDPEEGEQFTVARRAAFTSLGKVGTLLLEDVGVPLPALPALVAGIERISAERDVPIALVAHAGDGNTHPIIVLTDDDPDRAERARIAFGEVMDLAIGLDGTITGEHGVGRLKKDWLPDQLGEDVMALTRRIKDALDPQGILNPGAML